MKLGFLASALLLFAVAPGSPAAAPPNVVFILADDLGWGELGCYGQQKIPTPNVDRLPALIRQAEELLRREVSENLAFPVPIPARDTVELKNTD